MYDCVVYYACMCVWRPCVPHWGLPYSLSTLFVDMRGFLPEPPSSHFFWASSPAIPLSLRLLHHLHASRIARMHRYIQLLCSRSRRKLSAQQALYQLNYLLSSLEHWKSVCERTRARDCLSLHAPCACRWPRPEDIRSGMGATYGLGPHDKAARNKTWACGRAVSTLKHGAVPLGPGTFIFYVQNSLLCMHARWVKLMLWRLLLGVVILIPQTSFLLHFGGRFLCGCQRQGKLWIQEP